MIGSGIFALLGEAGAIAGHAVYISFILGGTIPFFSGYSLGKLGADTHQPVGSSNISSNVLVQA